MMEEQIKTGCYTDTLDTPLEGYPYIKQLHNSHISQSFPFIHTIYHYTPVSSVSVYHFVNLYNYSLDTLDTLKIKQSLKYIQTLKILKFIAGRLDFYWEYSRTGKPFFKKNKFTGEAIPLSYENLIKHFEGSMTIGFSPFINSDCVIFGAIDFDAHTSPELTEEQNQKLVDEAQGDSLKVFQYLNDLNLPVILNSSGSKGRHVRLCCPGAKAKDIRIFLKYVLEKVCGDSNKHEVFPKQDCLLPERPRGNQIKGALGIHRKTGQRANIILNGVMLDLQDSMRHICEIVDRLETFASIQIPKEDYERLEKEEDKRITFDKINNPGINFTSEGEVPVYCSFMEEIASKNTLPSGGGINRHFYLDPNIESYGVKHPTVRNNYAIKQGRDSNTAFDNWKKYSNNQPVFRCSQIISYLKHHAKNDSNCLQGLKKCIACEQFKRFIENKNSPKGFANILIISEFAKSKEMLNCLKCNNKFIFDDCRGFFYCKTCKVGGGIKLLAQLIFLKQKRKERLQNEIQTS